MAMNVVNQWDAPLKTIVEDLGTGTKYIGEAVPNAATSAAQWRISKVVVSSGTTTITWAAGGGGFNQIWDNRASLTYV